jgi:hypothetical protein
MLFRGGGEGPPETTEVGSIGGGVSEWAAGPRLSGITSTALPTALAVARRDPGNPLLISCLSKGPITFAWVLLSMHAVRARRER